MRRLLAPAPAIALVSAALLLPITTVASGAPVRIGTGSKACTLGPKANCKGVKARWGVRFHGNLKGINLQGADLTGADLRGSNLSGAGSVAWGGQGADRIVVRGKDSAGDGGPGRDRIVAAGTARTLLVGGIGRDVLVGGTANTLINARDGKGGDRIICRSSANRVMIDAGDVTQGPCTVIATG